MTVSQIATGEENALSFRIYTDKGAVKWAQENPNYLDVYRYGEERRTLTRGSRYLSDVSRQVTRVPVGHPEGYLEAFATIYADFVQAVRAHLDGKPLPVSEYAFPTVHDGVRGMEFIAAAVESANGNSKWVMLP